MGGGILIQSASNTTDRKNRDILATVDELGLLGFMDHGYQVPGYQIG